jgi:GNAT superfamily N-acetyltransferase
MDICRLKPDDWLKLKAILIASCKESPKAFAAGVDERTNDATFKDYAKKWSQGRTEIAYLLSDNNRDWGIILGTTTNVGHFWVAPEMRGKGYGKKLLKRYLDWAHERHVSSIFAYVTEGSEAIGFYKSVGFALTSESDGPHPGSGKKMIKMEVEIERN